MLHEHETNWLGLPIKRYETKSPPAELGSALYRLSTDWDEEQPFMQILENWLSHPDIGNAAGVVIGLYAAEMEHDSSKIVAALVDAKDKLKSVRGIFMNDIIGEEQEMSWIENSDMAPLLEAFPNLAQFRVRGGNGLALGALKSSHLKSLTVETGGLAKNILDSIVSSELPNLEHLEIWFGEDGYGLEVSAEDAAPLLDESRFPSLKYLGLRNAQIADGLAALAANSASIARLETLDLSLGTLTDKGGQALLDSPHAKSLTKLNLRHHFMSNEMMGKFSQLGIEVNLEDQEEADEYDGETYYYVAVGE